LKRRKNSAKKHYKVINWAEYNQALVDRGNFMLWISEDVIAEWRHENGGDESRSPFCLQRCGSGE
jgi:hypothetical protein